MKQIFTFFAAILMSCTMSLNAANYCASSAWGYGASATGGGSATPTLVTKVSELKAISKAQNKVFIITKSITVTSMVTLESMKNVTILALPGVKLVSTQQDATTSGILFINCLHDCVSVVLYHIFYADMFIPCKKYPVS